MRSQLAEAEAERDAQVANLRAALEETARQAAALSDASREEGRAEAEEELEELRGQLQVRVCACVVVLGVQRVQRVGIARKCVGRRGEAAGGAAGWLSVRGVSLLHGLLLELLALKCTHVRPVTQANYHDRQQEAKLKAEQASARRVAEVSELRSSLEVSLREARGEALAAREALAAVKQQLDGLLSEEWVEALEVRIRVTCCK